MTSMGTPARPCFNIYLVSLRRPPGAGKLTFSSAKEEMWTVSPLLLSASFLELAN